MCPGATDSAVAGGRGAPSSASTHTGSLDRDPDNHLGTPAQNLGNPGDSPGDPSDAGPVPVQPSPRATTTAIAIPQLQSPPIPPTRSPIRSYSTAPFSTLDPGNTSNLHSPVSESPCTASRSTFRQPSPFPPATFTTNDSKATTSPGCHLGRDQLPSPTETEATSSSTTPPRAPKPPFRPCRPSLSPPPTDCDNSNSRSSRRQSMARKRQPRRREGQRHRPAPATSDNMSRNNSHSHASHSGRQSSEGTLSERTISDGAQTAMTSVTGTDEELIEDMEEDSGEEMGADDDDLQSLYPASHYPSVYGPQRTEMPYVTADSLMADSDVAASTRSLWAQDLDYREIHNRTYCREWFMPIDELEQVRTSLNHQVFLHVLGGEHSTVQLENPTHVLDVGSGAGDWAIKMAEVYPNCEVVGMDIAAIAETRSVPMNVFFVIDDAEDWDMPANLYDLIHFRSMEGAFKDWKALYDNVYYSLKPGGWIELQDFDTTEGLIKFMEQFSPDSPIHTLFSDLVIAAEKSGRPRGNAHMNPRLFMDAGFTDVRATEYRIPITVAEKSAGKIWLISCLDAMEALCLRLLTEQMGWDPEKCKAACESAAREMADLAKDPEKSKGMVVKIRVVVGRKPFEAPDARRTRSPSVAATTDHATPTAGSVIAPSEHGS